MTAALAAVRSASRHGSSAAVLLSGPPGIGKTAVLSAVCREAAATGLSVLRGKCDPVEQIWPGALVLALLRTAREEVVGREEYERMTRLVDEPLVLAEAVAGCLDAAARRGPLLLALDDLQWADRVSTFILRNLVPRLVGLPVVWVLSARSDEQTAQWFGAEPPRVERIRLEPLGTADILALAQDRLGQAPGERIAGFLAAVDGNPFHAGRIIDELVRSQGRGEPDAVPAAFAASVAAALEDLPEPARELVEVVAVAGRPFPLGEAATLTAGESAAGLAPAVDAGLVLLRADGSVAFHHDLVREQIYRTIRVDRRRELHRRLAEHCLAVAGDPLIAASHARAAAVPGDLGVAAIMISAAEALAAVSGEDAGDLALAVLGAVRPGQPGWLDLNLRSLSVLCRVQWAAEAVAAADTILARADDGDLVGRVESDAARALWLGGRVAELLTRTERALRHDTMGTGVSVRLRAVRSLAGARLLDGETAVSRASAVLDEARASGDTEALALALEAAGHSARNDARHREALGYFRELGRFSDRSHLAEEVIELQFLDRYEHAQTLLNQAVADGGGSRGERLPAVLAAQAWQDFNLGRLDDAEAGCRALLEIGPRLGDAVYALDAVIVLVSCALLHGDLDSAVAHLRSADGIQGADAMLREPGLTVMNGWIAAGRGDLDTARALLLPVVADGADKTCSYWPIWPCWMGLFFEIGDLAADRELTAAATRVTELAARRNPGVASFEGMALLTRGRIDGDLRMIEQGSKTLAGSPRPLLRGFGAFSHGRALVAAGERQAGVAELDRAWDEFHAMGAWSYRGLAQAVMQEAGVRQAKWSAVASPAASGWGALTQAERKVAVLIGSGSTNKAAASELGVSVNTVGTHLRSVFAKLGIRSRVQLANVLHEESLL